MRLAALTLAALFALFPATAQAKEVESARACDDDGCRTITDKRTLHAMMGGAPTAAPAERAPFHRVRMTMKTGTEEDYAYTMAYLPSSGLLRYPAEGGYDWLAATPGAKRAFDRLVRGLEPLQAGRLRGAGDEEPVAQVHKVVPAPTGGGDGGGFPWTLLLIPAALALAVAGVRGRAWRPRPRSRRLSAP